MRWSNNIGYCALREATLLIGGTPDMACNSLNAAAVTCGDPGVIALQIAFFYHPRWEFTCEFAIYVNEYELLAATVRAPKKRSLPAIQRMPAILNDDGIRSVLNVV